MTTNVRSIGEVAENRSEKFRFGRNVANAFLSVAKLQKKANAKSIGGIRRRNFQFAVNPAILPMLCYRAFFYSSVGGEYFTMSIPTPFGS